MPSRFEYKFSHPGVRVLLDLETYIHGCGLEPALLELVKMRASQINGCAHCLDMHCKDARAGGETEQRLYLLTAWREAPIYSERERAALAWTEAVTQVAATRVSNDIYAAAQQFNEEELLNLTLAIAAINSWNRLAVSSRAEVGSYRAKSVE